MEFFLVVILVIFMFCYQGFCYLFEISNLKQVEEMEKSLKLN